MICVVPLHQHRRFIEGDLLILRGGAASLRARVDTCARLHACAAGTSGVDELAAHTRRFYLS